MKKSLLLLAAIAGLSVSACSPRYGYQPDDPRGILPIGDLSSYVMDNRYLPPQESHVPVTLPPGVFIKENHPMPEPPSHPAIEHN